MNIFHYMNHVGNCIELCRSTFYAYDVGEIARHPPDFTVLPFMNQTECDWSSELRLSSSIINRTVHFWYITLCFLTLWSRNYADYRIKVSFLDDKTSNPLSSIIPLHPMITDYQCLYRESQSLYSSGKSNVNKCPLFGANIHSLSVGVLPY
jgi:hypothetical protein